MPCRSNRYFPNVIFSVSIVSIWPIFSSSWKAEKCFITTTQGRRNRGGVSAGEAPAFHWGGARPSGHHTQLASHQHWAKIRRSAGCCTQCCWPIAVGWPVRHLFTSPPPGTGPAQWRKGAAAATASLPLPRWASQGRWGGTTSRPPLQPRGNRRTFAVLLHDDQVLKKTSESHHLLWIYEHPLQ